MGKLWKYYIDIHSHIIPDVDDGSDSISESMEMIETAYREGIILMIATPHYGKFNPGYDKDKVRGNFDALCSKVKKRHSDMKMLLGNEIYYSAGVINDLQSGRAMTLGGTDYVLIEFSVAEDKETISRGLREFVYAGYRPILAHTERYINLQKDVDSVRELVECGAYIQINARSFMERRHSRHDKRSDWSRTLLDAGLVHFIASDCHNNDVRKPIMISAAKQLMQIAEPEIVEKILRTNILKLIKNQVI